MLVLKSAMWLGLLIHHRHGRGGQVWGGSVEICQIQIFILLP